MTRHRDQPPSHSPAVTRVHTITVDCGRTGPEAAIAERNICRLTTLADVEAWTAELRNLGARDDLVLPEADGLFATMNVESQTPD